MSFTVDTNVINPAEITTADLYDNNCTLGTHISTHTYSTQGLVYQMGGLINGQAYFILLTKAPCGTRPCFGATHHLNVRVERDVDWCIFLSNSSGNPANTGTLLIYTIPDGTLATYVAPDFSVSTACSQLCFTSCLDPLLPDFASGNPSDVVTGIFPFSITGPSSYFVDETTIDPSGCFTLTTPGVYVYTHATSGETINITVTTEPTTPLLSLSPIPDVCDIAELNSIIFSYIENLSYYPGATIIINTTPLGDVLVLCPGSNLITVNGTDACGNNIEVSETFNVSPLMGAFHTTVNCGLVNFTPSVNCPGGLDHYTWDFGDFSIPIISTGPISPVSYTYATSGTYAVNLSFTHLCGDVTSVTSNVVIAPPTANFTFITTCDGNLTVTPNYTCQSLINNVLWNFGDGITSTSSFPGTHFYATPGTYTVTLTIYYYDNNLGVITTQTQVIVYNVTVGGSSIPLTIFGPNTTCSLTGIYSVSFVTGVTYIWSISPSSAGTVTSGAGTNTVFITWANTSSSGTITVTIVDANGCKQIGSFKVNACCKPISSLPPSALPTSASGPSNISSYFGVAPWPASTTLTGEQLYVYEDLTINVNFTFNNCIINVAPGKSIFVNPGINVNWNNGQVREMCNQMWQGIITNSATTNINANGTIFRAGITAIVSNNGANIDLFNCEFRNDFVGLTVKNYNAGPHPVTVEKCTFLTTTTLIVPYLGKQTHKGIDVENVSDFTIGSTSLVNTNKFLKMDYGIYSVNSNIKVWNNTFKLVMPTALSVFTSGCDLGSGICDINNKKPNVYNLTVGNTPSIDNKFDQCDYPIYTIGRFNEKIQYNEMDKVISGINIYNNDGTNIDISDDNKIKNYTVGMFIYNIPRSILTIRNNDLNLFGMPTIGKYGIIVTNPMPFYYKANIDQNYIDRTDNGIYLQNSVGLASFTGPVDINITNNTIHYTQHNIPTGIGTTEQDGIRIENSAAILVENNEISRTAFGIPIPASSVGVLRGIKINNSAIIGVIKNYVAGLGEGIRPYGNCNNSLFICNDLDRNYFAFNFQGPSGTATIGLEQLPGGFVQGNYYFSHSLSGFDLEGGINPSVDWWYNSTTLGGYNALSSLVPFSTNDFLSSGVEDQQTSAHTVLETCGSIPTFLAGRDQAIGGMAGTVTYSSDNNEFTLFDRVHAFRALKENPSWLTLGTTDDVIYQNFYSACLLDNIKSFDSVATCAQDDSLNSARILNQSIATSNMMEYNMKHVNELYFKSIDSVLSSTDTLELESIAYQNGTLSGPGVYQARAILKLFLDDTDGGGVKSFEISQEELAITEINKVIVYPNPNTGEFYLKLDNAAIDKFYTLEITDLQGKIIYGESFLYKGDVKKLSLNSENGVYLLLLKNEKQQVLKHEKLIISK